MNDADELPEGWAQAQIADVALTIPNIKPEDEPHRRFDYIDISSIDNTTNQVIASRTILGSEAPSRARRPVQLNDVLFSNVRTYLRNIALLNRGTAGDVCSTGFTVLRSNGAVEPHYLFRYVLTDEFIKQTEETQTGTHYPATSDRAVMALPIPLPPLAEQKRIVAKVEALLAEVNAARQRLAKVPAILKRFRQAVLAAACSGRLTEDWREKNPDVLNARTLFEKIQLRRHNKHEQAVEAAIKEGKRKPKNHANNPNSDLPVTELEDLPQSWFCARLADLTYLITDGTHRTPRYQESGVPFLSVKNVRPFAIRDDEVKWISQQEHQEINARCGPEVGDILYTKVGATFGYAAVNRLPYAFSLFVSVALIKPVQEFFVPDYVAIALNSEIVFDQARERVSGSGVPDLHLIEIRDFAIPLPPLPEQHEIVRRVEALFKQADQIEAKLLTATARVEKLTQAILAKAFRGEVAPTEAELARREGRDYEPASVLLERIRAQKEPATKKSRKGRGR